MTHRISDYFLSRENVRLVPPLFVYDNPVNVWRRNFRQPPGVEVTADPEKEPESFHQVRLRQGAAAARWGRSRLRNVSYWTLQILRNFPSFFFMTFVLLFYLMLVFVFIGRLCLDICCCSLGVEDFIGLIWLWDFLCFSFESTGRSGAFVVARVL